MKLFAFDFDGTLMDTPTPETGKSVWKEKTGYVYPHVGWWGRKESLDADVFDIKPFKNVKNILNNEVSNNDSMVIILTNRQYKLKDHVENILSLNNIYVDDVNLKKGNEDKGQRILKYLDKYPEITEIFVYDDSQEQIDILIDTIPELPENVVMNIYMVNEGNIKFIEGNNKLVSLVNEEINRIK
ncbi:MAG: hypothetical protein ACOC2W_01725 [bacterium]